MMNDKIKQAVLTIAFSVWLFSPAVHAADDQTSASELEEIVVTATRRAQSLQDAAVSVSALTGDFLIDVGAEILDDYYGFVPSMVAAQNTFGERGGQNIMIRGISNARIAGGADASSTSATTGFYLNDIPITPVDTQLFDVDRIEVLRGPQGTLYGAGSMGGAVKLFHKRANSEEFEGSIEGTAEIVTDGSPGGGLNGMLNIPIIEGVLATRIVGSYRTRGGYLDTVIVPLSNTVPLTSFPLSDEQNLIENDTDRYRNDTNSALSRGLRASVLYTPSERLSIEAAVLWQKSENDDQSLFNTAFARERLREQYILEPTSSEITLSSLDISYEFDSVTLHSTTGFYTREYRETTDFTPLTFILGGGPGVLDFVPAASPLQEVWSWETFTQEVRLQSNNNGSSDSLFGRLDWVLGAFYMGETRYISEILNAPGWEAAAPGMPLPVPNDIFVTEVWNVDDQNTALFADASFSITDQLIVSAGIRYFDQSTDKTREGLDPGNTVIPTFLAIGQAETGTTPRLNVAYNLSDDLMMYGAVADGFRLGGAVTPVDFNANPECESVIEDNNLQQFAAGEFESDKVRTYELGIKSAFAGGRATVNASVYQTDWTDMQQQVVLSNFPGSTCSRVLTANVGSAKVDGAELEISALPLDGLLLKATLSYTDGRITDPGEGVTVVETGDRLQYIPDWAGSLVVDYSVPITTAIGGGSFFVRGDVRYVGERSAVVGEPANPLLILDAYTLVGFRTGVVFGENPITVTLYVNNVFDEIMEYNANTRFGVSGNIIVATGMPRTVGVRVRKDFK